MRCVSGGYATILEGSWQIHRSGELCKVAKLAGGGFVINGATLLIFKFEEEENGNTFISTY